ncbi:hypothetical protein BDZ45DRAFT_649003 [Acephala macrosclerotiorum]|nr:hypothetical protein BDZ45DRAFT_649003 [Acephala macrosclerotiorum]
MSLSPPAIKNEENAEDLEDTKVAQIPMTPIEDVPYIPPVRALQFITQTGGRTTDPALKKKVRQHARNYISRSRGIKKATPHSIPHNEGISSPATNVIENELLMTFCRFDTQMMTFVDARSQHIHDRGKRACLNTVREMPKIFTSLREATLYWQVVMRRCGHFLLSTNALQQYSSEIDQWSAVFAPLSHQLQQGSTDIQTTTALLLLRLYSLTLTIAIQGTAFTSESSYDTFLPSSNEIIILSPIDILRMKQYDGPWDRYMIAAVGKWIMDVEQAGEQGGFVPEDKRVRLSRMAMSMERRSVAVQVVRRRGGDAGLEDGEGELEWVETRLDGPWT